MTSDLLPRGVVTVCVSFEEPGVGGLYVIWIESALTVVSALGSKTERWSSWISFLDSRSSEVSVSSGEYQRAYVSFRSVGLRSAWVSRVRDQGNS